MADQMNQNAPSMPPAKSGSTSLIIGGIVVLIIIIAAVAFFWMRGNDTTPEGVVEPLPEEIEEEPAVLIPSNTVSREEAEPTVAEGEVREFTVIGREFSYSPAEIRVQQGDTVRITLQNGGTMPHDWRLDEFNAATSVITPGQQETIEFVADQAGEFEYYCSVGQHRQQGMVGTLIVE
ncbi:MAG: cupredoxin domain-containing protein [Acidobacteriota bacterium]